MLKRTFLFVSLISLGASAFSAPVQLKSLEDKVSYGIGANIGSSIKNQPQKINTQVLLRGLKDSLNDRKLLLSKEQMAAAFQTLQEKIAKKTKIEGEKNSLIYKVHTSAESLIHLYGKNLKESALKRDKIAIQSLKYMLEKTNKLSF